MDVVGRLFRFELLSFASFESCSTIGDIAAYIHDAMSDWLRLEVGSVDSEHEDCLGPLNEALKHYLRKSLVLADLDETLIDIFCKKRKRRYCNTVANWILMVSSNLGFVVPASTPRYSSSKFHPVGIALIVYLVGYLAITSLDAIYWDLPDWVFIVGFVPMVAPFAVVVVLAFLADVGAFTHHEPQLTLRQAMVRYAEFLRNEHGTCSREFVETLLVENWSTSARESGVDLETEVPWLSESL